MSFQVVDKLPKSGGTGSRTKFENTFKDLNESLDIEDSQDKNNRESRSYWITGKFFVGQFCDIFSESLYLFCSTDSALS